MEEMEQQANIVMEQAITLITSYGLSVIGAIAILVIGVFLSRRAQSVLVKILKRSGHVDDMLSSFFGSLLRYLVLAITIISPFSAPPVSPSASPCKGPSRTSRQV